MFIRVADIPLGLDMRSYEHRRKAERRRRTEHSRARKPKSSGEILPQVFLETLKYAGLSYTTIKEMLCVSERTIEDRFMKINRILHTTNKTAALIKALKLGLIVIEDLPYEIASIN